MCSCAFFAKHAEASIVHLPAPFPWQQQKVCMQNQCQVWHALWGCWDPQRCWSVRNLPCAWRENFDSLQPHENPLKNASLFGALFPDKRCSLGPLSRLLGTQIMVKITTTILFMTIRCRSSVNTDGMSGSRLYYTALGKGPSGNLPSNVSTNWMSGTTQMKGRTYQGKSS